VLRPEGDGTWTLRQMDGKTGLLGDAVHTSEVIGDDSAVAIMWSTDLVDTTGWHSMRQPYSGAFVDETYTVVNELAYQTRPGRSIVVRIETDPAIEGVPLLVIRERWSASDLESDPLYICDYTDCDGEADTLRRVSDWFGLDPDEWITHTPGVEWRHR
jgi:hypothetical protein